MRLGVDLAAQDLLRAGNCERGNLLPQRSSRARLLVDVGLGAAKMRSASALAAAFASSRSGAVALFRGADDLADTSARLGELFVRALARGLQLPPALLARGESVGDLLWRCSIARISGGQMNFTVNQMKARRRAACAIKVRLMFIWESRMRPSGVRARSATQRASRGFANAKNMPMPRPMMNEASIRRSSGHLALQRRIISGWRAAPSRKRLHIDAHADAGASAPSRP